MNWNPFRKSTALKPKELAIGDLTPDGYMTWCGDLCGWKPTGKFVEMKRQQRLDEIEEEEYRREKGRIRAAKDTGT